MPFTSECEKDGQCGRGKGRCDVGFETQVPDSDVGPNCLFRQFPGKGIVVSVNAVGNHQVFPVRTEGPSFREIGGETAILGGVVFRSFVHDSKTVSLNLPWLQPGFIQERRTQVIHRIADHAYQPLIPGISCQSGIVADDIPVGI